MALNFVEVVVPEKAKRDHGLSGGDSLAMFRATVNDGSFLRVMSAREPTSFEAGAPVAHHVSISVGPEDGVPRRRPTDDECKEALSLAPAIEFEEDDAGNSEGSKVRHFWQKGAWT